MYPRLSDIFKDLFGINLPLPIYSFGAMVAIAVLTAAWLVRKELDRKYAAGQLNSVRVQVPAEKGKGKGKKKRSHTIQASPSMLVGTITIIAVVGGFAGAKFFHILENLDAFIGDPIGMVFSTGGFTFFGGLIVAAVAIAWFVKQKGLPVAQVADAFAPGLILGYGIGRIGCHLAGDGDWGITANLAAKPDWLPMWLWAETYPNNILNINLSGQAVYPTPLYEFAMALILFGVLWALRKHVFLPGWLFSLYLFFTGMERFIIEKIRVNNTFEIFGITATQAEIISVSLMLAGIIGLVMTTRKMKPDQKTGVSPKAAATSA